MPTAKPVRGYSPSYWIAPFQLEAADDLTLNELVPIESEELQTHFREAVENAIADFRAESKDQQQRPTDAQVRAALKQAAIAAKKMYDFLCHPKSANTDTQLDGISRQLIRISLSKLRYQVDTIATGKEAMAALWKAAEHAEKAHRATRSSKLKGGRRVDGPTRELVARVLNFFELHLPGLSKARQNRVLLKVLEIAGASCSTKTIESIRRRLEQTTREIG